VIGLGQIIKHSQFQFLTILLSLLLFVGGCSKEKEGESTNGEQVVSPQLVPTLSVQQKSEGIFFLFAIENKSNHTVTLTFPSSKMFDITVTDSSGAKHFQYSSGKSYSSKSEKVQIKGGSSHIWKAKWNLSHGERKAGIYKVNAALTPNEITPGSINEETISTNAILTLQAESEKIENNSFRNISVSGADGSYMVTGEARVFEAMFAYAVSDGHQIFIEQHEQVNEGGPAWSPFTLEINIEEDDLPINGTLMLELFYYSPKDGEKADLLPVPLQTFK
jgi:hypothetical protein